MHNRHPLESKLEFILNDKSIDNKTRSEQLESVLSTIKTVRQRTMTALNALVRITDEVNIKWCVAEILKAIPDINTQFNQWEQTALMMAVNIKDTDSMKVLLAANVDPNIPDKDGVTPLIRAASYSDEEPVNILLDAHADTNKISTDKRNTALICACSLKNPVVGRLLKESSSINHQNKAGNTALDAAIEAYNYSAIDLLLSANAAIIHPRRLLNFINSHDLKDTKIKFLYDKLCLSLPSANANQTNTSQTISVKKIIEHIQNKITQSSSNDSGLFSSFRDVRFSENQIRIAKNLIQMIQRHCTIVTDKNSLKQILLLEFQLALEKFDAFLEEKIKFYGVGSVNTQLLDPDVKSNSTKKGTRFHSTIYALSKEISMCTLEHTISLENSSQVIPGSLFCHPATQSVTDSEGFEMQEMKSPTKT